MKKLLLMQGGLLFALLTGYAQPYQPSRAEILERYKRAKLLDSLATRSIFKTAVRPHWSEDNGSFWYRNIINKDSSKEYIYVDVVRGTRKKLDAEPTDTITRHTAFSRWTGRRWGSFANDSLSPDKQWVAVIRDNNVYIRGVGDDVSAAVAFTSDGNADKPYGQLAWSPDGKYVVGYHVNPVKDSAVYYVLSSVSGTTRGVLKKRPYKQPGDPFTSYEMFLFRPSDKKTTKVNTPVLDFFGAPELHWKARENRYFAF